MHAPVLLEEMLQYLEPKENKIYLDCTFGSGGYSRAILNKAPCLVVATDQDPNTLLYAKELEKSHLERFKFYSSNFAELDKLPITKIDGAVFDIGTSAMQLNNPERGFSFQQNGLLDMRMNPDDLELSTAKELIDSLSQEDLADLIYQYGEERNSRKIAKAIFDKKKEISTTFDLAQTIRSAVGIQRYGKIDAATKTFQALRIAVNNELENFSAALKQVTELLNPNGRIVVVTFHSLEDKIAKDFFKQFSGSKISRSKYAVMQNQDPACEQKLYKILTKKPITPGEKEIKLNPRARSAKLRAAIKI
jgi:16S rRNA (cytosine1402-N4)-methyltransferase